MKIVTAGGVVSPVTAAGGGNFYRRFSPLLDNRGPTSEDPMLWTIFVILLVLWLLGVVTSYTLGGFIHVLLVVAVVIAILQLIQGRRVV